MHPSTTPILDTTSIKHKVQSQYKEEKTILFPHEKILFYAVFILGASFLNKWNYISKKIVYKAQC